MPLSDANELDAVVHALGIEDSDTTPAEAVGELKAEIERLRAMRSDRPDTTVRVRIKVAVWPDGSWAAYGDNTQSAERTMDDILDAAPGGDSTHWVEATLPLPVTVEGEVV